MWFNSLFPCPGLEVIIVLMDLFYYRVTVLKTWDWFFKSINPNTFAGLVGKVQKTISGRRKEGRVEKKARSARPPDPGLEPGTCRVLGEGP